MNKSKKNKMFRNKPLKKIVEVEKRRSLRPWTSSLVDLLAVLISSS